MCLSVEVCCFCVTLEAGSKIVAVVNLVLAALISLTYGSTAATLSYLPSSRRIFYGLVCAAAVGQLLLGSTMTYGAFRRKPRLLWIWVRVAWLSSLVFVAMAILGSVVLTMDTSTADSSEVSTMASAYLIYGAGLYYSASVVNSRRLEIVREDQNEAASRLMRQQNTPKSLLAFEDIV
ncbi:unnamed protein product, partial [Iphiclides podalirius]